jgi:predicted ATP-dependent endonuclease of OLD family
MSHIVEFSVNGLAGRNGECAFRLNDDLNIFFGLNGCGKTSLLKILHSAMSGDASILRTVPFRSASVRIYSRTYDIVVTRSIEKQPAPDSQMELEPRVKSAVDEVATIRRRLSGSIFRRPMHDRQLEWNTDQVHIKTKRWRHRYLPTSRLYTDSGSLPLSLDLNDPFTDSTLEENLDAFFGQTLSRLWLQYSSELLSKVGEAQENAIAAILRDVFDSDLQSDNKVDDIDLERAYRRASKFLAGRSSTSVLGSEEEFNSKYQTNSGLRAVVNEIYTVEGKIEAITVSRDRLQQLIQTMFSGPKSVRFTDQAIRIETAENEDIGIAKLSSGEKHVLKLFIEALLVEDSSILIDEPELSLHLDWQRRLVNDLRLLNSGAQYILASHSPDIMADVDDSKIFRL